MKESTVVLEWLQEGETEARRADVVEVLEARFGTLTPDLISAIRGLTSTDTLRRLLVAGARANSLAEFRAAAGV